MSSILDKSEIILLVDLTKISDRVDILMVGLAYRHRCIPLAWRCLPGNQPWSDKQVHIWVCVICIISFVLMPHP